MPRKQSVWAPYTCDQVHTTRENEQIAGLQAHSDPFITFVPDVEIPMSLQNIADLLVLVQVLVEETLDLVLVNRSHGLRRDSDHITVLVMALGGQLVHGFGVGEMIVEHS
jgi:hypothetical protein